MLKINLLPPHIRQRKQMRAATALVIALVLAEIGGMIAARSGPARRHEELTQRKTEVQSQLQQVQQVGTQAQSVLAEERALAPKYDFITKLLDYNEAYPNLYETASRYTYAEAMYLDLEASNNQLKFNAYVSKPADVSRLMLGLSRCHEFTGTPQIQGVPGWNSQEQARRRQAQLEADLPDSTIIRGSLLGSAPGGAPYGGAMGSYPGGTMSGSYPGGGMSDPGLAVPGAAGYPGGGMAMGGSYPGGSMGGYAGGAMGGAMGGGGSSGNLNVLNLAGARKQPMGFNVVVTCQLRNPITKPSYPFDARGGGGQGGGGGMMYGGMGGYPGGGMGYPGGGMAGYPGGGMAAAPAGANGPIP